MNRDAPTVRQLRCLVAIADFLHFGDAAAASDISQPALSGQLSRLEEVLGVQLVERTTRRVSLTQQGEAAAVRARQIVEEVDALIASTEQMRAPLSGPLHLGVIPTIAPYLLPPVLSKLRAKHPELQLILHEQQTSNLVESLRASRIDVALLALPVEAPGTTEVVIGDESFLLVAPENHRLASRKNVTNADLANEEVLLLEDGHCLRDQALEVCSLGGARESSTVRANSISTLVQMVANGLGVTLLPESAVRAEVRSMRDVRAIPFRGQAPSRSLGLLTRSSLRREGDIELLRQLFVKEVAR